MLQNFKPKEKTVVIKKVSDGCMILTKENNGVKITYIYGEDAKKLLMENENGQVRRS